MLKGTFFNIRNRIYFTSSTKTDKFITYSGTIKYFSTHNNAEGKAEKGQINYAYGSKYFAWNRVKSNIKLLQQNVKTEEDLRSVYDDYVKLMANQENDNKLKCKSCGATPLNSKDPNNEKYYKIPKVDTAIEMKKESENNAEKKSPSGSELELMKEMGIEEDVKNSVIHNFYDIRFEQKVKEMSEVLTFKVDCLRCRNLKSHGVYNIDGQNSEEIMNKIPADGTIVNVVSLFDFPLSCDLSILKGRNPKDIWYVVTKADLFFGNKNQLQKTGTPYVADVLQEYLGADPEKVFLVSSLRSWHNEQILEKLPEGKVYFVGRANAGKSSLIKSIIASVNKVDLQTKVAKNIEKKKMDYLEKVGLAAPGANHIPGFTRDFQQFKLNDKFTVIDTPGIFPSTLGIHKYILEEVLRKEPHYPKFVAEDSKRYQKLGIQGPKLFSGDSLYSYGGFFYLQPPKGAIIKRCLSFKVKDKVYEARYRHFGKAKEINETRPKQIGNRFAVKKETMDNMQRYVIPPFYGTIDIVIQDLGFISIQPTSSPQQVKGLFQIWVPEGVRVIVRESIFSFIYKTHDLVDETGNRLKKENIARRGATRLRRIIDEDKLHFTELLPIPNHYSSDNAFAAVCPPEDRIASNFATSQEEYKNQYWRRLKI